MLKLVLILTTFYDTADMNIKGQIFMLYYTSKPKTMDTCRNQQILLRSFLLTFLFQKIYVKKCFPLDIYSIVNHVPTLRCLIKGNVLISGEGWQIFWPQARCLIRLFSSSSCSSSSAIYQFPSSDWKYFLLTDWNIFLFLIGIFSFFELEYFPFSNWNIFFFLIRIFSFFELEYFPFSNWNIFLSRIGIFSFF